MNETTKSDMIMIMHRLKRLIGSFYHQKRIDIIITDNAHKKSCSETGSASHYLQPVSQAMQSGRVAHRATTV